MIGCDFMKDRIIEALKSTRRAMSYEEIDSLLNIKTIEETHDMLGDFLSQLKTKL